jgi:hypothetical protein
MTSADKLSWNNPITHGFVATAAYYALGLGTSYVLAQRMPFADMCNPGVPLLVGAGVVVLGLLMTFLTLGVLLFSNRYQQQATGSLFAHMVCISVFIGFVALEAMQKG